MSGMLIMPIAAGNPPQYTIPVLEEREIQRKYRQTHAHIERILHNMVTERWILITVNREKHACICRLYLASDNDLDYIPRKIFTISTTLGASSISRLGNNQRNTKLCPGPLYSCTFHKLWMYLFGCQHYSKGFVKISQCTIPNSCNLPTYYSIELCPAQISCSYIARWANKSCFSFRSPTRLLSSSQSMNLTWRSWKRRWT